MKDDQDFNIWFVKEIQKHACLYNHTDLHYTNRQKQEEVWQDIAARSDATVGECKERWKNLRACFTRHLKHRIVELKNGVKGKKGYYLAEHMNFILPFSRVRSHMEDRMKYYNEIMAVYEGQEESNNFNVICVDTDEDNESSRYDLDVETTYQQNDHEIYNPLETQNQDNSDAKASTELDYYEEKPQLSFKRKRSISENDADLDFFTSLLPDVKSMNDSQKRKFRIKVLTAIDEILEASGSSRQD